MSSHTHSLGRTVHIHQQQSVELRAAVSATLSSPIASLLGRDEADLFEAIRSGRVWVVSPPSFELRLRVRAPGDRPPYQATDSILTDMAECLGKAQLWSELRLVITSQAYSVVHQASGFWQLNIDLQLQQDLSQQPIPRSTRLPSALSALLNSSPSLQPPPGIHLASIREIDIILDVDSMGPTVGPVHRSLQKSETPQNLADIYSWPDMHPPEQHSADISIPPSRSMTDIDLQLSQISDPTSDNEEMWESLDAESPFSSQQSGIGIPFSGIYSCIHTPPLQYDTALSLLDSGFRGAFSPQKPQRSVTVTEDTPITSLIELAPGIFDPEYRDATSQRACFIPSVAKALTSLLTKSDSQLVKAKLETLTASVGQPPSESDTTESGTPDLNRLIKCLLWRTMHRGISQSQRPRKLCPLWSLATGHQWHDSLLDNAGADEDGYNDVAFMSDELHSINGDGDEDMLSHEPNLSSFDLSRLDLLLSDDDELDHADEDDDFYLSEIEQMALFAVDFDMPLPAHGSFSSPALLSMQESLATSPLLDACDLLRVADVDKLDMDADMVMLDCSSPAVQPNLGLAGLEDVVDADMLL